MYGPFHAKSANRLHKVLSISMKFGTLVDLTKKLRMQKKFLKNFHYLFFKV